MSLPVFGHQDAAKIRVSFEAYAEQVEDFAFVVVGARPDRGDGLDCRIGTGRPRHAGGCAPYMCGKECGSSTGSGVRKGTSRPPSHLQRSCNRRPARWQQPGTISSLADGQGQFVAIEHGVDQAVRVPRKDRLDGRVIGQAFRTAAFPASVLSVLLPSSLLVTLRKSGPRVPYSLSHRSALSRLQSGCLCARCSTGPPPRIRDRPPFPRIRTGAGP